MIAERKQILLKNKILLIRKKKGSDFIVNCYDSLLDKRILISGIDLTQYATVSHDKTKIKESIYRYAIDDLTENLCKQCNVNRVKFISIEKGWYEFCCNRCSSKYKVDHNICWITKSGWHHSDETKKKMSKNHADFSGDNNPFKKKIESDMAFRIQHSENVARRWASYDEEKLRKISETFSKAQSKSSNYKREIHHKNHKSGHFYSNKMDKQMFYRSSWEHKVCEFLEHSVNVLEYDIEPFSIEYYIENGEKRYTRIDFFVRYNDSRQIIIEVKPSIFLDVGKMPFKIKGCEKYALENNLGFVVITENELKNLELYL